MASRSNRKITAAKRDRERGLVERRLLKQARKATRKAEKEQGREPTDVEAPGSQAPGSQAPPPAGPDES